MSTSNTIETISDLPSDITIFTEDNTVPSVLQLTQEILTDPTASKETRRTFRIFEKILEREDEACLSPRTALAALSDPTVTLQEAKDIAVAVANTAETHQVDLTHQSDLYATATDHLQAELDRKRAVPDIPPYGFIPNDNKVPYFVIHDRQHHPLVAPYICKCPGDPSTVIGTLGGPNPVELTCPLYSTPRHSDGRGLSALPPWFVELLHAQSPHADALIDNAYKQDDWGLAANLRAYHFATKHLCALYQQEDALKAQIKAMYEQQEYVRHRLERAQASSRLVHFRSLVDGVPTPDEDKGDFHLPLRTPYRHKRNRGRLAV